MAEEQEQLVEEAPMGEDADMGEDYPGDAQAEVMEDAPAETTADQPPATEIEDGNGGAAGVGADARENVVPNGGSEPNHQEQGPDEAREQELATAEDERQRNQEQEEQLGADDGEDPMSQPPHGTEVFISKVPREATDAQLRAFCETAGEVYAMRIPKDRESNTNKGYCFCVFKHRESAEKAMTVLEGREVKDFPGRRVNVVPSIVKNKLYIGQMPRDITREELEALLKVEVVGLEKIELMMDKETNQARGFGFLAFYNAAAATLALRKLSRPEFRLRGHQVQVMWADPKRDEIGTEKVKSIYVGNLPEYYTENDLRSIFAQYGTVDRVTLLYTPEDPSKLRNYAFVNYTDRVAAVRAVSEAENKKHMMGEKELIVHMAKPQAGRDDGGMGMGRGYGGPGGYGYPPRGYGPPGRGGGRGPGGRGPGRGPPGGGRGYGGGHGGVGGRGYHHGGDYGHGYDEGYDYGGGYEEGYEEEYEGYGYGYGYGGYPSMPIMPVVVPSSQFGYAVVGGGGYHEGGAGASGAGGPVRRGGGAPAGPGPRERGGEGRPGGEYGAQGGGYGGGGYGGSSGRVSGGYDDRGYGEKYSSRGEFGGGRQGSYEAAGGHRDAAGYGGGERYYGGGHTGGRGGGGPSRGGYGAGERGGGGGAGGYGERAYGERGYGERSYSADRGGGAYAAGQYGGERGVGGVGYGTERAAAPYGSERAAYGGSAAPSSYGAPPPPSRGNPGGAPSSYASGSAGYHGGSGGYTSSSGGGRPSYQGGSGSYTGGSGGSRPPAGPGGGSYGGRGGPPPGPRYAPY